MNMATNNMVKLNDDLKDGLVLEITDRTEQRLAAREDKKFRVVYALIALISFVGIGVITQFIEFYSQKAVSERIDRIVADLKSEKLYAQLLILSSKIEAATAFSSSDRDTVMRLLEDARAFPSIQSEPGFPALLNGIVGSFAAADAQTYIDKICTDYSVICFEHDQIASTLLQHYGRLYISIEDVTSTRAEAIRDQLEKASASVDSKGAKGAAAVFRSLARFRELNGVGDAALAEAMASYAHLSPEDGSMFHQLIDHLSAAEDLGKIATPDIMRTVKLTQSFRDAFRTEIQAIPSL